jgi:DNA-binding LacI/PurR family transcriptional regulator
MTLGQLAEQLGLSKAAVSYALRESPMVSRDTQQFVQQRARELGYTPNPVASAFLQQVRSQGSKRYQANLAFLIPARAKYSHLKAVQQGAQERAQELGYSLDCISCRKEDTAPRLTRLLLARGILGVAVSPLPYPVGHINLDWSKFAAATYGYSMARPAIHRIVHHHLHGIRTAFRACKRKGFRRIGLLLSLESDTRSNRLWSSGFLGLQQSLPKSEKGPLLLAPHTELSEARIGRWLLQEKPDLVLLHALGCFPRLDALLKNLPFPVAKAVLDKEPHESCAGIDQQFHLSGRLVIDLLSSQILHNQRGIPATPILSMVEGTWIDHPGLEAVKKVLERRISRRKPAGAQAGT